ncbi:MAG: LysM peptidoglycan-binding domain-containing protein, partial [Nitrospiraceae bacterium]
MPVSYTVKPGDTLGKIARKFYGDAGRFPLIVAANAIANPDKLTVGQELVIPDATMIGASPVTSTSTGPVAGA